MDVRSEFKKGYQLRDASVTNQLPKLTNYVFENPTNLYGLCKTIHYEIEVD